MPKRAPRIRGEAGTGEGYGSMRLSLQARAREHIERSISSRAWLGRGANRSVPVWLSPQESAPSLPQGADTGVLLTCRDPVLKPR